MHTNKKKTQDQFVREVEEKGNNEYKVLGQYVNNRTKILIKHIKCGNEYLVKPNAFLNGRRCPICNSLKKKPTEYLDEFNSKYSNEYELLSNYVNARTKVTIKHKKCGTVFQKVPNDFKGFCPKCNLYQRKYNAKKTINDICKEIKEIHNGEYKIIGGRYLNKNSKLTFKHNICGTTFTTRWHDFKNLKTKCPKCSKKNILKAVTKSSEIFEKEFNEISKGEYTLLSKYVRTNKKIKIKHNICGHIWECLPNNFLSKSSRCPKCKESKGEKIISKYLVANNVEFIQECKFPKCKDIRELPFDFYLPKHNICIEYDGKMHYEVTGLNNDLTKQIYHDSIKSKFCKNNKIQLIRIPYWNIENIENILNKTIPSEA